MKREKPTYYSEEFKWKVVQEVLSGRFTKEEARKIYGIRSNCAILYWMRKYSGIDDYRQGGMPIGISEQMQKMKENNKDQKRIKELEEALKHRDLLEFK